MDITPIEYVRAALCNAIAEGMDIYDVYLMAEHAQTCERFDAAVNELASASPEPEQWEAHEPMASRQS
jgi:hypothetical protein